jgi:dipeptidyl aminopeptidase/acylaminoacyl peptidase
MMSFFEATMSRPAAGDAAARPARPRFVAAWAALALLAMPAAVAAQMTPEHVVQLEQAGSVALSPDGRFVAYTVTTPRAEEEQVGRAFSELWVVPAVGGTPRRLIERPLSASGPAWSPDGGTIGFVARIEAQHPLAQVYGIAPEGGEPRRLTESPIGVSTFSWMPDGQAVLYTALDPLPPEEAERRRQGWDMHVAGDHIRHVRLWHEGVGTGQRRAITPANMSVRDYTPAPNGQLIAVQMTDGTTADDDLMYRRIYVVAPTGGEPRHLAPTSGKLGPMAWSPDSRQLAFLSAIAFNDPLAQSVYVVPATGGQAVNRTPDHEQTAEWVGWLDNNTLLYTAAARTRTVLNRVGAASGAPQQVLGGGDEIFRMISMDAARRTFATAVNTRMHPNEVYTGQVRGGALARRTQLNPWLATVELGRQETIEYRSRDGMRIEAVITYPVNYVAGQRYPLAILPHGGPEGIDFDGWTTNSLYPGQVLAANGYVVFRPNYRGSGGRGPRFTMANHRDLGGKEFEDVLDGIDHLDRLGVIDPRRVGSSGTSYGGYFSAWAGTRHSERFAAAITFAGLSNWVSFTGTTDIPVEMSATHWDLDMFENMALFMERSPVSWIRNARTPILVATGMADERVHPEQAIQFHNLLQLHGTPTGLILYPREPHGLLERAHQLDFMRRMLDWFGRYLQAPRAEEDDAAGEEDGAVEAMLDEAA